VTSHAAVAVHDDFTPRQTGVALRSANDETAGGIDEKLRVFGQKTFRQRFFDNFLDAKFLDGRVFNIGAVLGEMTTLVISTG